MLRYCPPAANCAVVGLDSASVVGYLVLKTANWLNLAFFQREAKDGHIIDDPDTALLII